MPLINCLKPLVTGLFPYRVTLPGHDGRPGPKILDMDTALSDLNRQVRMACTVSKGIDMVIGSSYGAKLAMAASQTNILPKGIPIVNLDIAPIRYQTSQTLGICDYMEGYGTRQKMSNVALEVLQYCYPWTCDTDMIRRSAVELSMAPPRPPTLLTNPCLVIRGKHSPYIPIVRNNYDRFFKNYSIQTVNAGHFPHLSCPKDCAELIYEFVKWSRA